MLDSSGISFISYTNDSSKKILDSSFSISSQNYDISSCTNICNAMECSFETKFSILNDFREITRSTIDRSEFLLMVEQFYDKLTDYVHSVSKMANIYGSQMENEKTSFSLIKAEIKTWKLIQLLYRDRLKSSSTYVSLDSLNDDAGLYSEIDVLKKVFRTNKFLREAQIVVEWLEFFMKQDLENSTDFLIGSHGKSWEHTRQMVTRRNTFSLFGNSKMDLDPDAPLRGCIQLSDMDKNDESEYLRFLFHCIRSGDFERAKSVCHGHEELWRSASLEGWRPFSNPLTKDMSNESLFDVEGNPNRSVFKSICWKLSEDSSLNLYERAIYSIFCGNLKVLNTVDKTWSALLWAHFKVYVESSVESHLNIYTRNGHFQTQSLFGNDDFGLDSFQQIHPDNNERITRDDSSWDQIFNNIESSIKYSPLDTIKRGFPSVKSQCLNFYVSMFETVQQFIILNDIDGLLEQIQLFLSKLPTNKTDLDKQILRFLSHLSIFLYSVHSGSNIDTFYRILEQFIVCLIDDKCLTNVAFYVSKLSTDLQIKNFCKCLMDVTQLKDRRRCIQEALEFNLPIVDITRLLVQIIRQNNDDGLRPLYADSTDSLVTESDHRKINALDWLTFLPDQHCHLVRQTNALCRSFLLKNQIKPAQLAMDKVTDTIWKRLDLYKDSDDQPVWLKVALHEYFSLRCYVECMNTYSDWEHHFNQLKPTDIGLSLPDDTSLLSFQEKQVLQKRYDEFNRTLLQWDRLVKFNAERIFQQFTGLLSLDKNGWLSGIGTESNWSDLELDTDLITVNDSDSFYNRLRQISALRKTCMSIIVDRLVHVLVKSKEYSRCLRFVDLLADEQLQLYQVLEQKQIRLVLSEARCCSMMLMADGKDPLGM